jgi:hypothetical protein
MLTHVILKRRRGHPAAWLAGRPAGRIRGLGQLRWPPTGW